jgi:hypothetical protein
MVLLQPVLPRGCRASAPRAGPEEYAALEAAGITGSEFLGLKTVDEGPSAAKL